MASKLLHEKLILYISLSLTWLISYLSRFLFLGTAVVPVYHLLFPFTFKVLWIGTKLNGYLIYIFILGLFFFYKFFKYYVYGKITTTHFLNCLYAYTFQLKKIVLMVVSIIALFHYLSITRTSSFNNNHTLF